LGDGLDPDEKIGVKYGDVRKNIFLKLSASTIDGFVNPLIICKSPSRHQPFFFYSTQESPPKPWAESTGAFAPQQIASNHQGLSDRKKVF